MFKNVRYSVSQLKKGMIVGKDIIVGEKVALSAGVELTDRLIESLEFLDVKEIVIKEKVELNQTTVNLPQKPLVTTQQKFLKAIIKLLICCKIYLKILVERELFLCRNL